VRGRKALLDLAHPVGEAVALLDETRHGFRGFGAAPLGRARKRLAEFFQTRTVVVLQAHHVERALVDFLECGAVTVGGDPGHRQQHDGGAGKETLQTGGNRDEADGSVGAHQDFARPEQGAIDPPDPRKFRAIWIPLLHRSGLRPACSPVLDRLPETQVSGDDSVNLTADDADSVQPVQASHWPTSGKLDSLLFAGFFTRELRPNRLNRRRFRICKRHILWITRAQLMSFSATAGHLRAPSRQRRRP
jgi:hypothetical protein